MKKVISVLMILVLVVASSACGAGNDYDQKLSDFADLTFKSAYGADLVGDSIIGIWYDKIYGEIDVRSRMFNWTTNDFNEALGLYFNDSHYIEITEILKDNQAAIDEKYTELKDQPKGFEDGYEIAQSMYESYEEMLDLVINPSGSLEDYSKAYNEARSSYFQSYEKMFNYLNDQEFVNSLELIVTTEDIDSIDDDFNTRLQEYWDELHGNN